MVLLESEVVGTCSLLEFLFEISLSLLDLEMFGILSLLGFLYEMSLAVLKLEDLITCDL